MATDRRSETSSSEEDGLRELEEILVREAKQERMTPGGGVEAFTPEVADRIRQGLLKHDETRQRLRVAQKVLGLRGQSFPELLRALRESARISVADAASILRTDVATVRRIESGETDPFGLAPEFVVSVMEVYSIGFSALAESLKFFVAQRAKAAGLGALAARTTKAGVSDLERTMRDVAGVLAEEDGDVAKAQIPTGFLEEVRQVLERWGRDDLLDA